MNTYLIEKYASVLCGDAYPPEVRDPRLLMAASGDLKIYYVPFKYTNQSARTVLVEITPGLVNVVGEKREEIALVFITAPFVTVSA